MLFLRLPKPGTRLDLSLLPPSVSFSVSSLHRWLLMIVGWSPECPCVHVCFLKMYMESGCRRQLWLVFLFPFCSLSSECQVLYFQNQKSPDFGL